MVSIRDAGSMKVSSRDVSDIFNRLISGQLSREDADRWAYSLIQQSDQGKVEFLPPEDEKRIWAAIMFIYGVDLKESPGIYLHSENDIKGAYLSFQDNQ